MRTLGRYTLLQRLEVGAGTETWLAVGPGAGGATEQVRLSRLLPTMRDAPWVAQQLERVRSASHLPAPWVKTHFVGVEGDEPVHVQALRPGVRLSELAAQGGLPPEAAARCAIVLCEALEAARGVPFASLGFDERELYVGWDGALQLGGFDLDARPETFAYDAEAATPETTDVVRVCLVLSGILKGRELPMTRMAFPPMRALAGGTRPLHQGTKGVPKELLGLLDRNLNPSLRVAEASVARLKQALMLHAGPAEDAQRWLAARAQGAFVAERAIDFARRGLSDVDGLEPLPNDHVAKVHGRRDTEGDWLVLGDWFQGLGHPRGKLIALQMQGEATTNAVERRDLAAQAQALVDQHAELRVPADGMDARLTWRWGYVETAELAAIDHVDALRLMLGHPSLRFLEQLIVLTGEVDRIAGLLPLTKPPPTLRVLKLPRLGRAEVTALKQWFPALTRIERAVRATPRAPHAFFGQAP